MQLYVLAVIYSQEAPAHVELKDPDKQKLYKTYKGEIRLYLGYLRYKFN